MNGYSLEDVKMKNQCKQNVRKPKILRRYIKNNLFSKVHPFTR